jgi:hypothetical protein
MIQHSDNHSFVVFNTNETDAGNDLDMWEITNGTTVAKVVSILTDDADTYGASLTIDQGTNGKYVAWVKPSGDSVHYRLYDGSVGATVAVSEKTDYSKMEWLTSSRSMPAGAGRFYVVWGDSGANSLWGGAVASVEAVPGLTIAGTVVADASEGELRAGSEVITFTLVGGTWGATLGAKNIITEALRDGMTSAQSELLGWNNLVRGGQAYEVEVDVDTPVWHSRGDGDFVDRVNGNNGSAPTGANYVDGHTLNSSSQSHEFANLDDSTITDAAAIQNAWDGGGSFSALVTPYSDGGNDQGRIASKTNVWALALYDLSAGSSRVYFRYQFSGTNGQWQTTDRVVAMGKKAHVAVAYDPSDVANQPTVWVNGVPYTVANGGLTQTGTPAGTRDTDVGFDMQIGGIGAPSAVNGFLFNGRISEPALFGTTLTQARVDAQLAAASNPFGLTEVHFVRTSDTVITATLPPIPNFDITVLETITVTAPASAHSGSTALVGTPTFDITTDGLKTIPEPDTDADGSGDYGDYNGGLGAVAPGIASQLGEGGGFSFGLSNFTVGLAGPGSKRRLLVTVAEIVSTGNQ